MNGIINVQSFVRQRVLLHFEQFDVQESSGCSNDNVTLTDTATGIELFTLCGRQLPDDVTSTSNEIMVVFATDSSVTTTGFLISYESFAEVFGRLYRRCDKCTHASILFKRNCMFLFHIRVCTILLSEIRPLLGFSNKL